MVQDTMSFLWVARRGLYESEMLDLVGVSRMTFSPFFFAIQESLVSRAGIYNFFHEYLRQAVELRYLPDPSDKR
jgi:nephrocystin-3